MSVGVRSRPRLLVALLILLVLGGCWTRNAVQPLGAFDQPFYLGIAFDLLHHGRYTDGYGFAGGNAGTIRPSGMRFTPLYPALLAAAATMDPRLRRGMDCLVAHQGQAASCPRAAPSIRWLQFGMLAGTMGMLCWCGWRCSGRPRTGLVALGLALPTAPLLLCSVDYLMTEIVSLFLVVACQALALRALPAEVPRDPDPAWLFASGLALGLAVLSRPAFAVLALAALAAGMVRLAMAPGRRAARALLGFAAGTGCVVLPWILRNALVMGRPALTFGYASHTLVQRLSFDAMTRHEYALSFVCWLPDGNGLGAALAGRHACDRFGWNDHPDSFYAIGIGPMLDRTLAEAGGWSHHMSFLVHGFLLRDPVRQLGWHVLVTIPLALRGLYLDHWWGFVLGPVCAVATGLALRDGGPVARRFLLLSLPGWFMLGVNAAVAVDQVRYNLMLLVPLAVAGALAVERVVRTVAGHRELSFARSTRDRFTKGEPSTSCRRI